MLKRVSLTVALALLSVSRVAAVAPDPPQSLTATVNGRRLTLTWLPASTGGAATSYLLEAALSPGGPAIATDTVVGNLGAVYNTVVDGTFYVRVRGVNVDGTSGPSNEVVVVLPSTGCSAPPNAPTNLTSSVVGTIVTLNWNPPVEVCPGTGYLVQAGLAPGFTDVVINHGPTTTFIANAPVGTYYVRVVAVNNFGVGVPSNEVEVVVTTEPPNLVGRWSGTSNYFNAPFTFDLTQNGSQIGGRYSDQHDQGFVAGLVNTGSVTLDVNFGDTGIRFEGSIEDANRIRGRIRGSVIGGPYNFEMTRQ
jgi:hypothetical protein